MLAHPADNIYDPLKKSLLKVRGEAKCTGDVVNNLNMAHVRRPRVNCRPLKGATGSKHVKLAANCLDKLPVKRVFISRWDKGREA